MSGPRPAMERTLACSSSASNAPARDKQPKGRAKSPRRPATAPGRSLNRIVEASGSAGDTPSDRKGGNRNVIDVKVKSRSGRVGQPWVGVTDRNGVALGLADPALVRMLCRKRKARIVRTGATVCELRCRHAVGCFARHWKRVRSVVVGVDPNTPRTQTLQLALRASAPLRFATGPGAGRVSGEPGMRSRPKRATQMNAENSIFEASAT